MSTAAADLSPDSLRYPIGKFRYPDELTTEDRATLISTVESLPTDLRSSVEDLDDTQLDTPYREGGWTVRQVVHHIADSHVNAYVRFRLALTEENPLVKPYDQRAWAELPDARTSSPELSLRLLSAVHARWVLFMHAMSDADWKKTFLYGDRGNMSLERILALYAWHGRHHLAHISNLRDRMSWQ